MKIMIYPVSHFLVYPPIIHRGNFVGQSPYMTGNNFCSDCPAEKPYCNSNLCSEFKSRT